MTAAAMRAPVLCGLPRVGSMRPDPSNDRNRLVLKLFACTPDEFADTLPALADGAIDPAAFQTGAATPEEAPATFARLDDPREDVKVMVQPWR